MQLGGGGCGNVIALVATRAGIGRQNESKRREEEDVATAAAAMSFLHGGQ